MSFTADLRDMLDLPAGDATNTNHPRPSRKSKLVDKRPEGVPRELFALLGDHAPPIALNDGNKYKGRRQWLSKARVRPWERAAFQNPARDDGLVLRHWQRVDPGAGATGSAVDGQMRDVGVSGFAKYNVKPKIGERYTDEQYETHLQSQAWSREETDYLVKLAEELDLRWVLIADRYDYAAYVASKGGQESLPLVQGHRSMEEMKARYYTVAAKMLAIHRPLSDMSETEFNIYEKMTKFNPEKEKARKEIANAQLNRSRDVIREEAFLLEELKRIIDEEQQFIEDRNELAARLEAPVGVGNTAIFHSSHGLQQLQALLAPDKSKKRRPLNVGPEVAATPISTTTPQTAQAASAANHNTRDSSRSVTPMTATTMNTSKKPSISVASTSAPSPTVRKLTPAEEAKYGVTHHDRLISGVIFRNDRAIKLTQAKSNVQTQKLAAGLTELDVAPRLVMATEKVCREFEKLVHQVQLLLDTRKIADRVSSEIRILEAAKRDRERKEGLGPQDDPDADADGDADGDPSEAGGLESGTPRGRAVTPSKRSASVQATGSTAQKGVTNKRLKK